MGLDVAGGHEAAWLGYSWFGVLIDTLDFCFLLLGWLRFSEGPPGGCSYAFDTKCSGESALVWLE